MGPRVGGGGEEINILAGICCDENLMSTEMQCIFSYNHEKLTRSNISSNYLPYWDNSMFLEFKGTVHPKM